MPTDPAVLSLFPVTSGINAEGHLTVGGCDTVGLAQTFGTPLVVFDVATIRRQCRAYMRAFSSRYGDAQVFYAGKAYLGVGLLRLIHEERLSLDVVSGGELFVAGQAGFPAARICFHGNNKAEAELAMALEQGVGRIAVDNLDELGMLAAMAESRGMRTSILLRLAPAVDPHTHAYIATGLADSKFGLPIQTGMALEAVRRALSASSLELCGYHVHIGSQIHMLEPYRQTITALAAFAAHAQHVCGYTPPELSLGGGWAVRYIPEEQAPDEETIAETIVTALKDEWNARGLPLPRLCVEPGRGLVARAGVALYAVGATKDIAGVRRYVFVNGGMADNIRPALYGARYTAVLANRMYESATVIVIIAGPYCESADILVRDAALPAPRRGDVVALAACGAYAPAMASNYNMALRPAIVAVDDGRAILWRRRETLDDLVSHDGALA